ncbi:LLM class flavin-dependent oxidoreductase [Nitriliruptoraceae bacterium ZYF776]|nr:LLM class flavin-dependent oxidoreductase [Profundirhabdus halotolerans]
MSVGAERTAVTLGVQGGASPLDLPDLAADAEELGYVGAFSEEANATDAVTVLAAATRTTSRMQLGTGIIPVFGRAPAVIAIEAATMQILSQGRFVLGLGASSEPIATRWRGEPYVKPVTRLREYVEVLRRLLDGERVVYEGQTVTIGGFQLALELTSPPPIHVAALGPRTLEIGGALSDGVFLAFMTPQRVREAAEAVASAARGAGRDPSHVDVASRLLVMIDEPEDAGRRYLQRLLAFYLSSEVYRNSFDRQGFDSQIAEFRARWESGDRSAAVAGLPDELLDVAAVRGTVEQVRARIDEYRAAGLTTPMIYPLTVATDPEERLERMRATLAALAPAR